MKNKKVPLLCKLGFHNWNDHYVRSEHRRTCLRCKHKQIKRIDKWITVTNYY